MTDAPPRISENSLKILQTRYIDPVDRNVDGMWDRVSMGNKDYRKAMADLLFLPNSPTLFNLGLPHGGTLSACFVFDVEDSLLGEWPDGGAAEPWANSILGTNFKASCVAKAGGGVGYYLGNIRPKGSPIKSTHKKACGPVTVLKYYHYLRSLITQGGKRDLAQMGVLNADHPDIREFIHVKDTDPQGLSSFNISVSWKNDWLTRINFRRLFMNGLSRPIHDDDKAATLWLEQCESAWRTGCPGMLFWDTINRFNATPHLGDINATNPCGETPNLNNEPCNLGSLAVVRFLRGLGKKAKVAWDELKHWVRVVTRFMDDILDANKFPHPDITQMALATRKLGLGVMGWADLLALSHIPYDCQDAVDLADELMRTINDTALDESLALAREKGPYPAWEQAPHEVKKRFPAARNSTRTSIAPTGTIAIIADVWGSIEPHYAIDCTRTTHEGIVMNDGIPLWVRDRLGGFVPKIASEIDWRWHIRHQAAFQKHTNLGVSKTINMPKESTVQDVSDAYQMMWETECKGGTIFRDGCRDEQVLVKKDKSVYAIPQPTKVKLPDELDTRRKKFRIGGVKGYIHAGLMDGRVVEVFIRSAQQGSTVGGMLDAWCMAFSSALQNGQPLEDLIRLHRHQRFEPNGFTGDQEIPSCTSIPDFVVQWLALRFLKPAPTNRVTALAPELGSIPAANGAMKSHGSGRMCPDCGTELRVDANCYVCPRPDCGFSQCS